MDKHVYSKKDEIEILKGLHEFSEKNKGNLVYDRGAMYKFVRDRLESDITRRQFVNKVSALKKKYEGYMKEGINAGNLSGHDAVMFELGKKVWADAKIGEKDGQSVKAEAWAKMRADYIAKRAREEDDNFETAEALVKLKASLFLKRMEDEDDRSSKAKNIGSIDGIERSSVEGDENLGLIDEVEKLSVGCVNKRFLRRGWDLVGGEEKAVFEKRWKKLRLAGSKLMSKKGKLIDDQLNVIQEACEVGMKCDSDVGSADADESLWFIDDIERFSAGHVDREILKKGWVLVGREEKVGFEKRWKKLQLRGLKLMCKRAKLIDELLNVI